MLAKGPEAVVAAAQEPVVVPGKMQQHDPGPYGTNELNLAQVAANTMLCSSLDKEP